MINNNYNQKFQKFFKKFEKQYFSTNDKKTKEFLFDLAVNYIEKNRDFVMQYPIIQYWSDININKKELIGQYNKKEINLYFHIPFCKTKCSYCNFHIIVGDKNKKLLTQIYLQTIKKEVLDFLKFNQDFKIKTIFIGGGTPSYLDSNELKDLLNFINTNLKFFFKKDMEFSFEGNPDSFNEEKLKILKEHGINRLSIGVQTFNNQILKEVNRTYNDVIVYKILKIAKIIGFKNINIDMLYGLPGHNYNIMKNDLNIVSKLDIEHITYYPLYYYENSILSKIGKNTSNIKEIYSFYDEIIKKLSDNGFKQYGREYFTKNNIHNYQNNYVSNDYLYGFGHSAYSFNKKYAFVKEQNLDKYLATNQSIKKHIKYDYVKLDKRLLVLGSRNIKINKKNIKNFANLQNIVKLSKELGLLNETNNYFILTKKGLKYQELLAHMFL